MIDRDRFWQRVHEALDRREDPLADAELAAWLAERPEQLESYAALTGALALLAGRPVRMRRRRWPWLVAAALAAAVAASLLPWPRSSPSAPFALVPAEVARLRIERIDGDSPVVTVVEWQRGRLLRSTLHPSATAHGDASVQIFRVVRREEKP
jgi:hypothetical protein